MERRRPLRFFWLLPFAAMSWSADLADRHEMQGHAALAALGSGLLAGVLWQVLDRRDPTDRLKFFAVAVCMGTVFLALVPTGFLSSNDGSVHAMIGAMAAVVLTEQAQRYREAA